MSKNNEKKVLPKLRFPEFGNEGEWKTILLGQISEFINGRAYKQEELLSEGKYKVLRVGNFFTNNEWYYSNLELDDDKYCNDGDLLYAWSASFGPKIWVGEKVIYHYHIWKVKNSTIVTKEFLFNLLDFESQRIKSKSANGFALLHITKGTIENWESHIPKSVKEQQKIADCLSSLDDLITAENQKLETLKAHKNGLLQNLFPAEGETVPKLRFKEFEGSGEWEKKTLLEVCKMQAGKFINASEITEKSDIGLYPCYGGNGLRGYTQTFTHSGIFSLIGRQGALCGNVVLADGKFHATEHAIVVTPEKNIDTIWLYFALIILNLNDFATGQAQPGLSVKNLEKIELCVPTSFDEQIKIGSLLLSIDDLVSKQNEKVEIVKLHKKGLLQGLFPDTTEITA